MQTAPPNMQLLCNICPEKRKLFAALIVLHLLLLNSCFFFLYLLLSQEKYANSTPNEGKKHLGEPQPFSCSTLSRPCLQSVVFPIIVVISTDLKTYNISMN